MKVKSFLTNLSFLILGAVFFSLCQPSPLSPKGFSCLAFIALVPYFVLAGRLSVTESIFWGGAYGAVSHLLLVFWLYEFSFLAFVGIAILYFFFFAVLTPVIRLSHKIFKQYSFLPNSVLYLAYEFLKTSGFLGFSYGVIGYSQWKFIPLIQIASFFGVWAVSAILVFPSAFFANAVLDFFCKKSKIGLNHFLVSFLSFIRKVKVFVFGYIVVLLLCIFPFFFVGDKDYKSKKIALIQPNSDPWKSNFSSYEQDLQLLMNLSDKALKADDELSLVVWPETAFVPRIKWHYRFRQNLDMFLLVDKLLDYIDDKNVPFLIGNDEALYDFSLSAGSSDLEAGRVDYNAALFFLPSLNVRPPTPKVYYKQHLVPFTEYFPCKSAMPFIYDLLLKADTHPYYPGNVATVFEFDGLKFSVPICFEDNFGYLTREFAKNGAELLINISNDAWSKSLACQLQHLSTSVFRAIETGMPMVRSTANGITCYINESGKVVEKIPPFEEGFLLVDCKIPKKNKATLYVKIGDVLGYFFVTCSILIVIYLFYRTFFKGKKNGKK